MPAWHHDHSHDDVGERAGSLLVGRVMQRRATCRSPLRDAVVTATWEPQDPQRRHEGQGSALIAKRRRDAVDLRGAKAGRTMLRISISHRHFLPATPVVIEREAELRDGALLQLALELAGVGGSVEVIGVGRVVRAAAPDGDVRLVYVVDGRALIGNLPAVARRIELCADDDCHDVVQRWDLDAIEPAKNVVLEAAHSTAE